MPGEIEVCPTSELTSGVVVGAGPWAVGNADGKYFAVSRRCRHLYADLADGTIDNDGCLTCPWHGSKYDVANGRMVLGPQGGYAKIPGLGVAYKMITRILPLRRGRVVRRDEVIYVE
ncbi:MAG: Rieske 2Fe-2S domain-containing protein [Acidimicrobiia bacterium]